METVIKQTTRQPYRQFHKIYINPTGRFVIGGPVGDSA